MKVAKRKRGLLIVFIELRTGVRIRARRSGGRPYVSVPRNACTENIPWTPLLIKTKGLQVEDVVTQVYDWCLYSGGPKATGPLRVTRDGVTVNYLEGEKNFTLRFVPKEADKGFQITKRQ